VGKNRYKFVGMVILGGNGLEWLFMVGNGL